MSFRLTALAVVFAVIATGITHAITHATAHAQVKKTFALLAASWQPAFCEQRPDRPECASQTATRYDANHFALHGLWPGPRNNSYCNINKIGIATDRGWWLGEFTLSAARCSSKKQAEPDHARHQIIFTSPRMGQTWFLS